MVNYQLSLSILFAVFTAWFVIKPFYDESKGDSVERNMQQEKFKEKFYQEIEDLELDFRTSKISQDDYNSQRQELAKKYARFL